MMKNLFFFTTAFLIGQFFLLAQTVTTFTEGTPDDGIALDSNGNIYCSNYTGDTVFKFTPTGEMTPFITGLNTPNGLAFNSNQELYVCDGQGNTIYKYDIDGNLLNSYPIAGHPSGIVKSIDDESMIFTLYQGNAVKKLAADGSITDVSTAAELSGPVGIVYDATGNLYVGNYNNRIIYKVLGNGDLEYIAQLPTQGGSFPNLGFISYGQGKLWGTVMSNHKIYAINPNSVDDYQIYAGSTQGNEDGDIATATFNVPNGIYFEETEGTLYVTDFGSKNLRIISGVSLGNDEFKKEITSFYILPNPAENTFEIQFQNDLFSKVDVKIYDELGKLVLEKRNHTTAEKIDISTLKRGVYLIEITTEKGKFCKKLVK
ncbi:MAG: T9SS type A sorting domain-containing protein [Flavobacteriaceae bacterium]